MTTLTMVSLSCASKRERRPRAAFTLVEMLVAITILSLLVILFSKAIGGVTSAWSVAQEKMDNFATARTTLNRLQADLQNLVIRDDLANFGEAGGNSALGFYTAQRGWDSAADDATARSISYVEYLPGTDDDRVPVLVRRDRSYTYAESDVPTFLPAPTPSADGSRVDLPPTAIDTGEFSELVATRGAVAFAYGFLHPDGSFTSSYYANGSNQRSRAIAVRIGFVVADQQSAKILEERNLLSSLASSLQIDGFPSGRAWSPKAIWDYQLGFTDQPPDNPGGSGGQPSRIDFREHGARFLDGIRTFERTYSFLSNF